MSLRSIGARLIANAARAAGLLLAAGALSIAGLAFIGWPAEQSIPADAINPDSGSAYIARLQPWTNSWLQIDVDSASQPQASRLQLREDGRLLGPAHAEHDQIRRLGGGRYSHWSDPTVVYFAASDGSDPRSNGRRYTVTTVLKAPRLAGWLVVAVLMAVGLTQRRYLAGAAHSTVRVLQRHTWIPWTAWALSVLPPLLLTLHAIGIMPLQWQTVALADFRPHQGFAYIAPLKTANDPPLPFRGGVVYENGKTVAFPNAAGWDVVATQGGGRFHLSDGTIFLSATDNSNPRVNGRSYSLVRPYPTSHRVLQASWALAALGTLAVLMLRWRAVGRFLANPPFLLIALCLLGLLAANRAWLFVDYPLVAIHPDSRSYYSPGRTAQHGELPNFGIRPPVYPLFLWGVFSLVDRALFLAFCQTVLTFVASLLLVYGAYRWKPVLAWPTLIVIALFLFGFTTIEHDTAMLSESVYTSCLMLSFAGLIIGLRDWQWGWLALSSAAMALAILTRPAGMFLIVTYALITAWLLWKRVSWRPLLAFAIPFPLLMVTMSVYNQLHVDVFAPTTWGEANLAVATFLYWETDPGYPPEVNRDIERIRQIIDDRHRETKQDPNLLDRSWDPNQLSPIFVNSFSAPALYIAMNIGGGGYESSGRQWIRRIGFDQYGSIPTGMPSLLRRCFICTSSRRPTMTSGATYRTGPGFSSSHGNTHPRKAMR